MKHRLFILTAFLSLIFLSSCTVDLSLVLQKDGSVDISFEGGTGQAFTKMIFAAAGGNEQSIDVKQVSYELAKAGFTNVNCSASDISSIRISMKDDKRQSYIFSSGIVTCEKDFLKLNITRKSLVDFYNSADEQLKMILDLFLAPVFNDEDILDEEYLELLATFYGEDSAKEVQNSYINIKLTNYKGETQTQRLPFSRLMCWK